MTGPTFSPDGKFMWDGNTWIPAPPQSDILPQSALNQNQISNVANAAGVPLDQLTNTAQHFDQNRDGVLQQSELQQAASSITQPPTTQAPQSPVMQQPVMQQPVVQQPVMQQPVMQQPVMQQPMMQQPVMQQPMMQQPVMQQPMMQQPMMQKPSESNSSAKIKIIASSLAVIIFLAVIINWVSSNQEDETIGLSSIYPEQSPYINGVDGGIGATDGSFDLIGAFDHSVDSSGVDWSAFSFNLNLDGQNFECASEKDDYDKQNNAPCKISWQATIPSYSPYDPSSGGGMVDVTEAAILAGRCDGDPFCGTTIYIMENGVDIVNSRNYDTSYGQLFIEYSGGDSTETVSIRSDSPGLLDHDNDGVGDYTDDCENTPGYDDVDSVGCTLIPDADNDGVNDDKDLLINGNAGLKIYISQLAAKDMEFYEDDQYWPCERIDGGGTSVPFSWINNEEVDCTDGSDEDNMRYPDWAYRLRVDWNCDEIYDNEIDMRNGSSFFRDSQVLNQTLNSVTTQNLVLSKDITDNLEKVCISVSVYDLDIVADTYEKYDVFSGTGDAFTLKVTLSQTKTTGDYSFVASGNNDDDDTYTAPDAGVTIRFLIYEVTE